MSKKIKYTLDEKSIDNAIKELEEYKVWVQKKTEELTRRLAEAGAEFARINFSRAMYSGVNDVTVSVVPIAQGHKIIAQGKAVCFIEFGTGVKHNGAVGTSTHPKGAELGMLIGKYGQGRGENKYWYYKGEPGNAGTASKKHPGLTRTEGIPAQMPMYHAEVSIIGRVAQIAKEVFSS